jgi:hypothetical protein
MLPSIKRSIRKTFPNLFLKPQGEEGVRKAGHRKYIGGAWDEIGTLQFEFLKSRGMTPNSYLLDIACGSLRLGVKAIPYLDPAHYLGIEKEQSLIDAGINIELSADIVAAKQPVLVQSSTFEFEKFDQQPDFAIAQSLFTHLTPEIIDLCFGKLRPIMGEDSRFYGTYFLARPGFLNPTQSHDHGFFAYTQVEMLEFGTRNGFKANYIGEWQHPRKQVMVEYVI